MRFMGLPTSLARLAIEAEETRLVAEKCGVTEREVGQIRTWAAMQPRVVPESEVRSRVIRLALDKGR